MIRRAGEWLESRRLLCYALAALVPVLARIALLPWIAFPPPRLADEFGHLLVADTLLHGRLANPAHPLGDLLETVYVLQRPSYASIYPIGTGMGLAAGVAAGQPWMGLLVSGALMGAGFLYTLRSALSMPWALAAAVVGGLRFGSFSYWMDSYWGGSVCAFGGALLVGGMMRWFGSRNAGAARMGMMGWGLVFLTRPYESVGLAAVVGLATMGASWGRDGAARRFALAAAPVVALVGAVSLFHNYQVTGSMWRTPYRESQLTRAVPQSLLFQPVIAMPERLTPEVQKVAGWQWKARKRMEDSGLFYDSVKEKALTFWRFYCGWGFTAAGLFALVKWGDRRRWFILSIGVTPVLQSFLYPFFFEHYAAACAPAGLLLAGAGASCLSSVHLWNRRLGLWLAVFLLAGSVLGPLLVFWRERTPRKETPVDSRPEVIRRLKSSPGRDLVLVRRFPDQNAAYVWVWNEADVDGSEIVWANEPEGADRERLLRYFAGRRTWVLELEGGEPRLSEIGR